MKINEDLFVKKNYNGNMINSHIFVNGGEKCLWIKISTIDSKMRIIRFTYTYTETLVKFYEKS